MGKKQPDHPEQAHRVKNNVKSSSSAKAAEMLASSLSSYGFDSELSQIGIGTFMEDSFDTNVDSDFRMALRKLQKKDTQTRLKALEELKCLIETKTQEDCVAIVSYWSKPYSKLTLDNERKIRETCQQTHEKLVHKIGKSVAPILKNIMPYWILAQADSFLSSARIAEAAFKSTFNQERQPEVVRFAKDEILNVNPEISPEIFKFYLSFNFKKKVLHEYLIVHTAKTLSDSTISEDEAQFKYETVVCMSLRGFDLFLKYFFSNSNEKLENISQSGAVLSSSLYSLEKIEKIFTDPKFWKFSKDTSTKIRMEFFQLINSTLDNLLINKSLADLSKSDSGLMELRKNLKAKIIPLVFYACDEDNQSCCFFVWQSILKSLKYFNNKSDTVTEDFWSLLNAKKAFIPKLIALMKNHANGNANNQNVVTIYESLSFLLRNLSSLFVENNEEKLNFYKDFFVKLSDAIFRQSNIKNRFNFLSDRSKMIDAMFDCLSFVLDDLISEDSNKNHTDYLEYCSFSISNYVLKICDKYLEDLNRTDGNVFDFETKFQKFIQETIESTKNAPVLSVLFWTELNKIIEDKLKRDKSQAVNYDEIIQKDASISNNFCNLFKNYWLHVQANDQSKNLLILVDTIFNHFYSVFYQCLNNSEQSNATHYIKLLNKICSNFMNSNMLDTFLDNKSSDLNLDEKLKIFNEVCILNLVQNVFRDPKNDFLLADVIELFLIVNLMTLPRSPKLNESLIKQIDKYLFDSNCEANQPQIEGFILNYLTNSKTNSIDSINKSLLTEWLIQSKKAQSLIINQLFTHQRLFSIKDSNNLAIQLVENLVKSEFKNEAKLNEKLQEFFLNYLNTIVLYSQNILKENSNPLSLQELNNYLNFCKDFLFKNPTSSQIATKLITLDNLWAVLLNSLILKSKIQKFKIKNVQFDKIQTNLDELINKFALKLFDDYLSGTDHMDNFNHLKSFIRTNLKSSNNRDPFMLNNVIILLINQFESLLKEETNDWMNDFYCQVIFNPDVITFKQIYSSLINEKTFLSKFWLDKRLNYIFARKMHMLVKETYDVTYSSTEAQLEWLRQIQYGLKMINNCGRDHLTSIMFKASQNSSTLVCNGEWLYLLLNALVLNKYDPTDLFSQRNPHKIIASKMKKFIQTEFKTFVNSNNLRFSLDYICSKDVEFKHLIENLIASKDDLNNVSLFLTSLVDVSMIENNTNLTDCLNFFSQRLKSQLISVNKAELNDEEIKFFIYDLPFAKHSIVDNINKLNENIGHYYNLFGGLVETQVEQLVCALAELKAGRSNQSFFNSLSMFNFNLDILTKYVRIYLSLLKSKNESSLYKILNCNETTNEFLKKKLAPLLVKILNLFIELKSSVQGSTYTFFFDLTNKVVNEERNSRLLNWQEFVMLDKLNQFLQLFFIDFKLQLTGRATNFMEQLSQFLGEKQWDFILCYTAAISQSLNKLESKKLITTQIFAINFFEMFLMLAKCMQFRVRDNRPGIYPKSVFSDWNGFFTKEIFDPIFCLYVSMAENYSPEHSHVLSRFLIKKLSMSASAIPVERLVFNELEPKFNAMDLNNENLSQSVINLTSSLKTVFNYLVPHLKHELNSIQICSFKILKKLMKKVSEYYSISEQNENCSDGLSVEEEKLSILESLPFIVSSVYYELNDLFADLKNHLEFNENILITTSTGDDLDDEWDFNENEDEEFVIPKEIMKKTEGLNLSDVTDEDQYLDIVNVSAKQTGRKSTSEMRQDANNKVMAYLLINNLILEMFSTENLEFKVKLVNNLREVNFNDYLMHFLFRLMPSFKNSSIKLFETHTQSDEIDLEEVDFDFESMMNYDYAYNLITQFPSDYSLEISNNNESFLNKNVQSFACKLYKQALKSVPAMIRDWFNIQPKRISDQVDKYTRLFVSPVLLEEEIKQINRSSSLTKCPSNSILVPIVETPSASAPATPAGPAKKTIVIQDDDESSIKIRGMLSTREVISTYKMKELNMELIIHLPINHPLGVIEVSSVRRIGVSENEWRNWLLQLTTYLTHQNGTIIQSLQIWKKNVDKKFSGVEECTICYNVINGTNYQLPKMKCRTCRKLFHSACLYKWFESSAKSTCPLCRNIF